MKPSSGFFLIFISACLFSSTTIADTISTTRADDANKIAKMYHSGMGVSRDMKKAFEFYQIAAELGNTDAQVDLGDIYYYGKETAQSYEKANYWYEKAAKNGNATAQMNLGYAYLNGEGVEMNYAKARNWLEIAVKQGQPSAMYHLGTIYFDGNGVAENKELAVELFKNSCSKGDYNACDKLKDIKQKN